MRFPIFGPLYELLGRRTGATSMEQLPNVDCALGSAIGLRRGENEDRSVILRGALPGHQSFLLLVVADGMGGMVNGAECARRAISTFASSFLSDPVNDSIDIRLKAAVQCANHEIYNQFQGAGGATLSAIVFLKDRRAFAVHVGDSRIYVFDKERSAVELVTQDDTIEAHVARLENRQIEQSSDMIGSQLVQFVGIGSSMEPHIMEFEDSLGKGYLLTSDGAHRLPKEIFRGLVLNSTSAQELIKRLLNIADWVGGYDNATAAAIFPGALEKFVLAKNERRSFASVWTPSSHTEFINITSPEDSTNNDKTSYLHKGEKFSPNLEIDQPVNPQVNPAKKSKQKKTRFQPQEKTANKEKETKIGDENQAIIEYFDNGDEK